MVGRGQILQRERHRGAHGIAEFHDVAAGLDTRDRRQRRLRGFRQFGKVIDGVGFNHGIEVIEDGRAIA